MIDALAVLDVVTREAMLFAAAGLLAGGVDDLAVDFIYIGRRLAQRWRGAGGPVTLADLPQRMPGRLAVFVPVWDEAEVIGAMLSSLLARYDHGDYRVYVGCYPNDRGTIGVVADIAQRDARVRLVIGSQPGPTTKAECLNRLWRAMLRDDAREGAATRAVVFHDAEDVVHAAELRVIDALLDSFDAVQLPVIPLVQRGSPLISGHYADEFAEHHQKSLLVRELVGAALPFAGVGCAFSVDMLHRIAARRGGEPFDAASLTEDYELGMAMAELGARVTFARVLEHPGGPIVATHGYFPARLRAAVRQKARWMIGIALAGWDRTGWGRWHAIGDHWMRMRDRRGPIAVIVLLAAYVALLGWSASRVTHWWGGTAPAPVDGWLALILSVNGALLLWRLLVRGCFTAAVYGWREARWVPLRMIVGNVVALMAARRAAGRYLASLRGRAVTWDKTAHVFPDLAAGTDA